MAKDNLKDSLEVIKTVSEALVSINGTYVNNKESKDELIQKAFSVLSREIDFVNEERKN